MKNAVPQLLPWGSKLQIQSVGLRYEILRKPLGLFYSSAELQEEQSQQHFGMVQGERVVAVLLLKTGHESVVKMRQVAVADNLQGKGIGKTLVRYAEAICREKLISKIELHARLTAVPFYLSLGYEKEGSVFEEVGIPHVKMVVHL